ncbi:MAG TPA: outer membrane beta-barrel protein [Steroidobacteraceae bacterium]|nr:outer membrane beta-barrel protein [Steroidobacteraceae bacterium]
MHTIRVSALAGSLLLWTAGGAARAEDGGWYLGANYGQVISTYRHTDLNNKVNDAFGDALTFTSSSLEEKNQAWWASAGYMTSPWLGFEAAYFDLGRLQYRATGKQTSILGTSAVTAGLDIKSRGPAAAVLGVLPLTNSWQIDARLGGYDGKTTTSYAQTVDKRSNSGLESKTSLSLLAGVGTSYAFFGRWALRIDYLHVNQVKEPVLGRAYNVNLASAGITFAF